MSVRPSVCPPVRRGFRAFAGERMARMTRNFTCWCILPPSERLFYGHGLVIILNLALFWLSETGQIWSFRAFPGERMAEIAWNFCTLMYLDHIQKWLVYGYGLLIFLSLALFWLSERVKFGVSGHFPKNAWRKWPEILYADVSWPPSKLISLWPRSGDFFKFWRYFDLVKRVKFRVSGHFPENALRKWPGDLHADVSWPPSELISSGSQSVDFCNFGIILT